MFLLLKMFAISYNGMIDALPYVKHKAGNLFKTRVFQTQNTYLEHAHMCLGFLAGIIRLNLERYREA